MSPPSTNTATRTLHRPKLSLQSDFFSQQKSEKRCGSCNLPIRLMLRRSISIGSSAVSQDPSRCSGVGGPLASATVAWLARLGARVVDLEADWTRLSRISILRELAWRASRRGGERETAAAAPVRPDAVMLTSTRAAGRGHRLAASPKSQGRR